MRHDRRCLMKKVETLKRFHPHSVHCIFMLWKLSYCLDKNTTWQRSRLYCLSYQWDIYESWNTIFCIVTFLSCPYKSWKHLCISYKSSLFAWKALKCFPINTESSPWLMYNLISIFDEKFWQFKMVERFIIVLYDGVNIHGNVNEAWREMFCKKVGTLKPFQLHRMQFIFILWKLPN